MIYSPLVKPGQNPINWPQDSMQIPAGNGGMPPVEWANRHVNGAEFSFLTGEINIPANAVSGTIFNLILPTDQDGDLWVNQIFLNSNRLKAGSNIGTFLPSTLGITDLRTARSLTYPGPAPIIFFAAQASLEEANYDPTLSPFPSGYRSTGTLIQPFCFTRQGGISLQLTLVTTNSNSVFTYSFSFAGWKEYGNASA